VEHESQLEDSTCVVCGERFAGAPLVPNEEKKGLGLCSLRCLAIHFVRQSRDPKTKD